MGSVDDMGGSRKEALFSLYEIIPGFALHLLVAVLVSLLTYRRSARVDESSTR